MLSRLLLAATTIAFASVAESGQSPSVMETVVVEATKIPTNSADLIGAVTLIDDQQIEQQLAQNIADLVRYEPGVNVVNQGSRFGLAGISIRGIGGNRVKIEVDGVPTSDAFSIGSFSNASRDFVDIDSLRQVEIIRGPASAMFGSDALGGVVSFITKGPNDLLGDKRAHFDLSSGFNSVDESRVVRATAAFKQDSLAAMFRVSYREGNERDVSLADPMTDKSLNLLGKLEWGEVGDGALGFTVEQFQADARTDVDSLEINQDFSARFGFPYVVETRQIIGDDQRERTRFSLGQEWLSGKFGTDYLRWRMYQQKSETTQDTFEDRQTLTQGIVLPVARTRSFNFNQDIIGFEVNMANEFATGRVEHQFSYGVEYERSETMQLRDGTETNLLSGIVSRQVGPDLFPLRDFPKSETESSGVYLQNQISLGSFTLTPGIRWDRYKLTPEDDSVFRDGNPGIVTTVLDEEKLSPKLGLRWDVNDQWSVYLQYAEGFRAPPVNDVNVGFTNLQFGYTTLPNPELESESSASIEMGIRFKSEATTVEAVAFETQYDDFIESFQVVGFDPVNQLLQFQSVNVDEVKIKGAELKGRVILPYYSEQFSVELALAYAEGVDQSSGAPINSVAPFSGNLRLQYKDQSDQWGGSVVLSGAARQNKLDNTDGQRFSPAGYAVLDAFGFWKPSKNTRLRAGLYNVLDRDYTSYLDVQGLPEDTANLARFERPRRNVSLAFDWQF